MATKKGLSLTDFFDKRRQELIQRLHQEMKDEIEFLETMSDHIHITDDDMEKMGEYFEDSDKQVRLPGCSLPSDPE